MKKILCLFGLLLLTTPSFSVEPSDEVPNSETEDCLPDCLCFGCSLSHLIADNPWYHTNDDDCSCFRCKAEDLLGWAIEVLVTY
jgi:hypothetical protein